MRLTFFRLMPLFGLHALICLLNLNARPAFSWWSNRRIAQPPVTQAIGDHDPWPSAPRYDSE